jgi:hypothetical protein
LLTHQAMHPGRIWRCQECILPILEFELQLGHTHRLWGWQHGYD